MVVVAIGTSLAAASGVAHAATVHGIAFGMGCGAAPVEVFQPTECNFVVANPIDADTLGVTSLVETVHGAGGPDRSGNALSQLHLSFSNGASCTPSQNLCTLPPGSSIATATPFLFHATTGADRAGHNPIQIDAVLTWQDRCDSQATDCPVGDQTVSGSSQSIIVQVRTAVDVKLRNPRHANVSAVVAGTPVYASVTVLARPGAPIPTGSVQVDYFKNADCSGAPAAHSAKTQLVKGRADVISLTRAPPAGMYSFIAHYPGNSADASSDGTCTPLTVVDASISISRTGDGPVGGQQHFTVRVRINPGTGWQSGILVPVSAHLSDGFGADHVKIGSASTCDGMTDDSGECRITFTSATPGTVTGNAQFTLMLAGVKLTRDTNPATPAPSGPGGSGPATRTFFATG
jgi:hypothetical protein